MFQDTTTNVTTIRFARKLNTNDPDCDMVITEGLYDVNSHKFTSHFRSTLLMDPKMNSKLTELLERQDIPHWPSIPKLALLLRQEEMKLANLPTFDCLWEYQSLSCSLSLD